MTPRPAAGGLVELKLGHYRKDGIEVVTVEGEIDIYTAPRSHPGTAGETAPAGCQPRRLFSAFCDSHQAGPAQSGRC